MARRDLTPEKVLRESGVTEIVYSSAQVQDIFKKKHSWVHTSLKRGVLLDVDGNPVEPRCENGQFLWTPEQIKGIAVSRYRQRKMTMDELKSIIRRLIRDTSAFDKRFLIEGESDDE